MYVTWFSVIDGIFWVKVKRQNDHSDAITS
jgi:hypothetical protein